MKGCTIKQMFWPSTNTFVFFVFFTRTKGSGISLGDFLCIPTPNTGQLNNLFHTFAELRLIVNRIVARQSTDWLAANAQFSPNDRRHSSLERIPS